MRKRYWVILDGNGKIYDPNSNTWKKFGGFENCVPLKMTVVNALGVFGKAIQDKHIDISLIELKRQKGTFAQKDKRPTF